MAEWDDEAGGGLGTYLEREGRMSMESSALYKSASKVVLTRSAFDEVFEKLAVVDRWTLDLGEQENFLFFSNEKTPVIFLADRTPA